MVKKIVIGVLSVIMLAVFGGYIILLQTVKNYDDEIVIPGTKTRVEVVYDEYAIPHIYAQNTQDAFRAFGYVQASDRLFQMEMLRRVGGGRLSEIFGIQTVNIDKYIRTVGLNENAKRAAKVFESRKNDEFKKNVLAFLEGVNAYIDSGNTPIEFRILGIEKSYFDVTDVYRILGYMGFGFSFELQAEPLYSMIKQKFGSQYLEDLGLEILESDERIPVENSRVGDNQYMMISENVTNVLKELPIPVFYGSNSWVISGKRTKSGKVLFANDTHIGFKQPSIWYEAHIETPQIQIYGNYLAGIPYPIIGHNYHHAWGLTIFPADAVDLFSEVIKDGKVKYKGEWVNLKTREETISVKGEHDQFFTVTTTPHGPIITNLDKFESDFKQPVSMFWVSNKVIDRKLEAIAMFSASSSFSDLRVGAEMIDSPGLNIMYGDVEGNIGWFGAAKLIHRPAHVNSKVVLDGASGNDDPLGFYPFVYNPYSVNPEEGFVYSANNPPDSTLGEIHQGYYYAGARARVIYSTICKKDDWELEDMKKLVMHNKSPTYPKRVQLFCSAVTPKTELESLAYRILLDWDGSHNMNDIAPTIYYKWWYHIMHRTTADELGDGKFQIWLSSPVFLHSVEPLIYNENSPWWDDINTRKVETRSEIFASTFTQTVKELEKQLGNDVYSWKWGRVHFAIHEHPLGREKPLDRLFNVGPIPSPGGEEVLNKIAFTLNSQGVYLGKSGPAMRILIDFGDLENSLSINPTGQSGNLMNKHYDDQAEMFVEGKFRKQKMNKNDIYKNRIGIWTFLPAVK